jgi:hypothetical protein
MQQSVLSALRRIEVEVLGVVTAQQMAELAHLQGEADQAEERMRELRGDIIDDDYIVEHRKRSAALSHAQAASAAKWRELFD